jgi:hypothetical protein
VDGRRGRIAAGFFNGELAVLELATGSHLHCLLVHGPDWTSAALADVVVSAWFREGDGALYACSGATLQSWSVSVEGEPAAAGAGGACTVAARYKNTGLFFPHMGHAVVCAAPSVAQGQAHTAFGTRAGEVFIAEFINSAQGPAAC